MDLIGVINIISDVNQYNRPMHRGPVGIVEVKAGPQPILYPSVLRSRILL